LRLRRGRWRGGRCDEHRIDASALGDGLSLRHLRGALRQRGCSDERDIEEQVDTSQSGLPRRISTYLRSGKLVHRPPRMSARLKVHGEAQVSGAAFQQHNQRLPKMVLFSRGRTQSVSHAGLFFSICSFRWGASVINRRGPQRRKERSHSPSAFQAALIRQLSPAWRRSRDEETPSNP